MDEPRNLCLFTLGINTAYRANELLSIRVSKVDYLQTGELLDLKQSKTKTYRGATLNQMTVNAIDAWLSKHPNPQPQAPLFYSQMGEQALCVPAVNRLVKKWCKEVGLQGNFGSHTLRKTWGFHQRTMMGAPVSLLTRAYGHASEAQTLEYIGIQAEEIQELYAMEL